jgi:hypothetical protein
MKPKMFIGSSVEGLNIAYALQQNLTHEVECTVWDQGVFNLSDTTMESIDNTLEEMDFGVFVFSGDDVTTMRNTETNSIRDNVLFEFGLFIGKLGRNRVFFVIPDDNSIHIPTDLLGVTPGKYEVKREDNRWQAATGAVCNQIRIQVKKLGLLRENSEYEESDDTGTITDNKENWSNDFINTDYKSAIEKLEKEIKKKNDGSEEEHTSKEINETWLSYLNLKINSDGALEDLCKLIEKHSGNLEVEELIIRMLCWEDYNKKALELGKKAYLASGKCHQLGVVLAYCHEQNENTEKSIELLKEHEPNNKPEVAMALADLFPENSKIRLNILVESYQNNPNNEDLVFKLAREFQENNMPKEALYLFDFLVSAHCKNSTYWGYLSNACVSLDLYEKGMSFCKKAEELSDSKSAWILHNIGNMLNNKGFYSEAITWLNKGIELDTESQYAYDRLSKAIKSKEEQNKKYSDVMKEGRKLLRNFEVVTPENA